MKKLIIFLLAIGTMQAALTEEQRIQDFQTMVSLYARQYAPFVWKQQAFGVDLWENSAWVARIRAAKNDLEFHEICAEWVAQLRDGHSRRFLNTNFAADLGVYVDIYDGKVLIEGIVRAQYPVARFPFEIGDELISLDGKSTADWIAELSKLRSMGNPVTTRRNAVDGITFRPQSTYPNAVLVGSTAKAEIRRANGNVETYELTWQKSGVALPLDIGPLPKLAADAPGQPNPRKFLEDLRTKKAHDDEPLLSQVRNEETGEYELRRKVLGWGSRFPRFGFPQGLGFQLRRGNANSDLFYTGVFNTENLRVGYLRIPSFTGNTGPALQQMDADLAFLNANTDGLVVDLTRNTGGGCIALDYAERLMDKPFTFGGEHLLATQGNIRNMELNLRIAQLLREPQWVIDTYSFYLKALQDAAAGYRVLSAASPACSPEDIYNPLPTAYTKPIVFLVDELTVSFGDYFMAVMQDNNRGLVVGQRTAGWGGSVASTLYGPLSEAAASFTLTLDRRAKPITSPDLPTAPFIENIGVIPDVPLDLMTRENLMTGGRPYITEVARLAAEHIRKSRLPSAPSR